jgi:DNA-binding SARP family transcriptional activator
MFREAVIESAFTLRLIGQFAILRGGRPLGRTDIGSRLARNLLALLAVDRSIHQAERIADALWTAARPQRPEQNVATMVSRLRRVLGTDGIVGGRGGYRLGPAVRVDLDDAAALLNAVAAAVSNNEPTRAVPGARRALAILDGGGVLDGEPHYGWAEPARARHTTLQRRARHHLAELALRLGDVYTAQITAERALATDQLDEVACRSLMRAYDAAGEPARAVGVFHRLRAVLDEELGVYPAAPTQEVYVAILRHQADPPRATSAATYGGRTALLLPPKGIDVPG